MGTLCESLRHDAEIELGREDGDCVLSSTAYHEGILALLDVVEAAAQAVILTYDASKTDAQNDEYQRRARRLNEALRRVGIGPMAE